MAVSRKAERELIRADFLDRVSRFLFESGEEVLRVKSNEIAIPCVGCEGNEDFIVINFKVPTGANKGTEPYDGYALAEDYVHNLAEKERKAEERKAEKAKKIARDAELRRKRAEIAEKGDKQSPFFWTLIFVRITYEIIFDFISRNVIIRLSKERRIENVWFQLCLLT